jgi:hypothetical protein
MKTGFLMYEENALKDLAFDPFKFSYIFNSVCSHFTGIQQRGYNPMVKIS